MKNISVILLNGKYIADPNNYFPKLYEDGADKNAL